MTLLNEVQIILNKLSENGWHKLLNDAANLNIKAGNLEEELLEKPLNIDRTFPGFKEFALEGNRGISPGKPAHSLLYHVMASPLVLWSNKQKTEELSYFPSLEEIETIENYIYSVSKIKLEDLSMEYGRKNISIVIFSNQYRQAVDTPHKNHADLVYSRTGISRVGNDESFYDSKNRSFSSVSTDKNKVRALPSKFNAYLAVKEKGSRNNLGRRYGPNLDIDFTNVPNDDKLSVWVPIHKLFQGNECIIGENIEFSLFAKHKNEKLKKIHQYLSTSFDLDSGSKPNDRNSFPFSFEDQIATFNHNFVNPIVHPSIISAATLDGEKYTFNKNFTLPHKRGNIYELEKDDNTIATYSSSLEFRPAQTKNTVSTYAAGSQRSVPEYAHARTKIINGEETDLNKESNLISKIAQENYQALHYVDYTGDGFVGVKLSSIISNELLRVEVVNAYSIVAPPDYYPNCDQAEIFDDSSLNGIWSRPPQTLADLRIHPNIQTFPELKYSDMDIFDTSTCLIPGIRSSISESTGLETNSENRISYLTDAAAGVFAPGWDTSFDYLDRTPNKIPHLSAYGLGSPFPEDAKLCAAISSFWPAVAPDIARSFWPDATFRKTSIPLTDSEIGSDGSIGWDGEQGPIIESINGDIVINYTKFEYVDYTINALNNSFDYHKLNNLNSYEYKSRALAHVLAKNSIESEIAILISYNVETSSNSKTLHSFKFMTNYEEISESVNKVKIKVLDSKEVLVEVTENDFKIVNQ